VTSQLQRLVLDFRTGKLVAFLNEWADGAWPPTPGAGLRQAERLMDCGLGAALDAVEAALESVMKLKLTEAS
jgi:hypothetical protein